MTVRPLADDELVAQMRDLVFRAAFLQTSLEIALATIKRAMAHTTDDTHDFLSSRADGIRKTLALVAKAEGK